MLIFGSTLLSLTIHLPTIIIAWNIDPLYASKFAISYQSIILVLVRGKVKEEGLNTKVKLTLYKTFDKAIEFAWGC